MFGASSELASIMEFGFDHAPVDNIVSYRIYSPQTNAYDT